MEDNKRQEILGEINACEQILANSDYKALKYAEGQISETEYAEIKAFRQSMRDRINELQKELEAGEEKLLEE